MSIDRILAHISKTESGCWIWTGALDKNNPTLRVSKPKRRLVSARRYAYETHNQVGVPSSFVVTSVCKNSKCVNPVHLTAQKRGTHGHRLIGSWKVEYCQRGHEFSAWNTGYQASGKRFCVVCDRAHAKQYAAKYRAENPDYVKQLRVARRKNKHETIAALKALVSCGLCKESNPACLDFHHKSSDEKGDTVSSLINGQRKLDVILTEVDKCIVLCANCHRKLHAAEKAAKELQ